MLMHLAVETRRSGASGGLITLERVKVIMYRPQLPEEERSDSWPIHITGSWRAEGTADGAPDTA